MGHLEMRNQLGRCSDRGHVTSDRHKASLCFSTFLTRVGLDEWGGICCFISVRFPDLYVFGGFGNVESLFSSMITFCLAGRKWLYRESYGFTSPYFNLFLFYFNLLRFTLLYSTLVYFAKLIHRYS